MTDEPKPAEPCSFHCKMEGTRMARFGRSWCKVHGFDCPSLRPVNDLRTVHLFKLGSLDVPVRSLVVSAEPWRESEAIGLDNHGATVYVFRTEADPAILQTGYRAKT